MKNLPMIGGILIAFFAIQIGNTAFGQSSTNSNKNMDFNEYMEELKGKKTDTLH